MSLRPPVVGVQVPARPADARPWPLPALGAALLACALPPLLAYNQPPSSTLLNQCLAVSLWGALVAVLAPRVWPVRGGSLLGALALLAAAALASGVLGALPAGLMLSALGLLGVAALLVVVFAAVAECDDGSTVWLCLATGLMVAGALSAGVALVQVFAPQWADGNWIAHSGLPGRAVGNLRQPNHLCSLLTWGLLATACLLDRGAISRAMAWPLSAVMVFAIELSASRTGAVGLALVAAWGLLDRRLSGRTRVLLVAAPLLWVVSYGAMTLYGHWSAQAYGAAARLASGEAAGGDSPNSRLRIWANALQLIAQQPWLGVGWGEFNVAWSLTAFPGRPTAFFDHTHNLPLHLLAELGVPLAIAVMALLGLALWQGWRRARAAGGEHGTTAMTAWMMVVLISVHSMVEYPLWYAYFLLPAACAWGYALGNPGAQSRQSASGFAGGPEGAGGRAPWLAPLLGVAVTLGGGLAMLDYQRVVVIYAPGEGAGSLESRIADGQHSVLYAHHADYAAATHDQPLPGTVLAFRRAPHYLLDTRLMMAWARDLAQNGQLDAARTVAQRLREFRNPDADEFFAACEADGPPPFQCLPPQQPVTWRAFIER
jgi:O-antigen ligase